jgi:hypothetical protein
MAARAVWRFVDWVLQVDASGTGPIYEAECTTCGESSGAADSKEAPEVWCLRHAGRSGHTGFRAATTTFFRATRAETGGAH